MTRKSVIATLLLASAAWPSLAAAAPVDAAPATAGAPADDASVSEDIVVIGRGETRQVQEISTRDFDLIVPATSPLKAISKLPGVNFQSADAFGN